MALQSSVQSISFLSSFRSSESSSSPPPSSSFTRCRFPSRHSPASLTLTPFLRLTPINARIQRSKRQIVRMAPEEERMTRRSPLDFPIEWERPKPARRPDIFPRFSPMKTLLPPPMPADPPEEDEEEEEKKEEEEEEDPEKEESDKPKNYSTITSDIKKLWSSTMFEVRKLF